MEDKRNINLTIADIPMNVNILPAEEEVVRKAAKEINERVLKYKAGRNEPEPFYFLAFTALLNTSRMLQMEEKLKEIEGISSKLDEYVKE